MRPLQVCVELWGEGMTTGFGVFSRVSFRAFGLCCGAFVRSVLRSSMGRGVVCAVFWVGEVRGGGSEAAMKFHILRLCC